MAMFRMFAHVKRTAVIFTGALAATSSAAQADPVLVPAASVSSVAVGDMDGDYYRYRALLVETDDGADLYIYVQGSDGMRLAARAPSIAWRGRMFGQEPRLEVAKNKSLKVISENASIGRDRWEQTLTIAYRGGRFVVAGYTYSYYDTLDPECGWNVRRQSSVRAWCAQNEKVPHNAEGTAGREVDHGYATPRVLRLIPHARHKSAGGLFEHVPIVISITPKLCV